jgi:hypothetical protein
MKQTVEIKAPIWGQYSGDGFYGNWHITAEGIQCRADADGASVYSFSNIGEEDGSVDVLAHDIETAWHAVTGKYVQRIEKEIKNLRRELDDLNRKADDVDCEIDDVNGEIAALRKRIADTLAARPPELAPEPEHLKNHPRLFPEEVQP